MAQLGFWSIAAADPNKVALVEPDHTEHRAGDLLGACNAVVHGLRALGIGHGDVVAMHPRGFVQIKDRSKDVF